MNGPEHYREAERLLDLTAEGVPYDGWEGGAGAAALVARAQVHATLALAAATAVAAIVEREPESGMPPRDASAWYEAAGIAQNFRTGPGQVLPDQPPFGVGLVKALTVRPPWSGLIAAGVKDTENRTWRVEPGTRLWIHAGVNIDRNAWRMVPAFALGRLDAEQVLGAILARVTVEDVHTCGGSCSPWAIPGQVHWRLADVVRLPEPVPCRGMLGLWTPPAGLLEPVG